MIPLEDFFRKPQRTQLRLSPSGRYLAWLEPWERRLNLVVQDLATGETRRVTGATERDLAGFFWASDERLVYVQDQGGDENYRLHAVSRDGTGAIDLTPFDGVQCGLVDDLENEDDAILFQMNRRDPQVFDVQRIDVRTGEMHLVAENPGNVQSWITDHDGKLRAAVTTDGVNTSVLYRDLESDPWRQVATYDFKEYARPLLFSFDRPDALVVSSNVGRDTAAIYEYDARVGRTTRLLYEHPEVDVGHVVYSRVRRRLTGAVYETDRVGYHFLDETRAQLQALIDERLPSRENTVVSHSRDERWYVVHSGSDRTLGGYWLLDAPERRLTPICDLSPWLPEDEMAPMEPVRFAARDGLTLRGYLTVPKGSAGRELPLVLLAHGGPWARDSWGFHPEAQFLASRGLAVLQVNFRGSAGFGRRFLEAGFRQWGLAMQDDLTDAVRWAVERGVADPRRVAIYGGSYGGYAALSGLVKTPELFACGVSYVGVSNLFTWYEAIPPYWRPYREMLHEMVGHPERDAERMRATSPYFHADRIRVPVLVAQGANDPRVKKPESDQIVEALRARGLPVEYLVKDDEGHGFHNEENQFEFYRALEKFLLEHLGVRSGGDVDLVQLIRTVFAPRTGEGALAVLVDLPDDRVPDRPAWAERRRIAADWAARMQEKASEIGIAAARLVLYPNVGRNNADLPGTAWIHEGGPARPIAMEEVLSTHSILVALTELSATAPLKLAAKRLGFRAATMPGFTRAMLPALALDYEEIDRRCRALAVELDAADAAHIEFEVEGTVYSLLIDLRGQKATASSGLIRAPGTAGNLPSGETYIVPYEGGRPGDPSRTAGRMPVEMGGEVVVYRIEENRAIEVEGRGPVAARERQELLDEPAYGNIAELGLGVLSEFGIEPIGEILLDEKLGLHIAFGRSDHFGGRVGAAQFRSPNRVVHIDRVYLPALQPRVRIRKFELE